MRQTTLIGFLKPRHIEAIYQPAIKTPVPEQMTLASCSSEDEANTAVDVEPGAKGSALEATPAASSLSATFLTEAEVFVPTHCPKAAVVRIRESHLLRLKSITNVLLPVRYPEKFFKECLHDPLVGEFCRVLLWNSVPIGWIRCRLETESDTICKLYIQAIGVLAPYRGSGLATALLECVIDPAIMKKHNICSVYAHVWQANNEAREWYEKRSFKSIVMEPNYYRRLQPAGAWIMARELT